MPRRKTNEIGLKDHWQVAAGLSANRRLPPARGPAMNQRNIMKKIPHFFFRVPRKSVARDTLPGN
jgi:hypothetical protein